MTLLSIDECKPGMVLSEDVVNHDTGAILLSSGIVLNRKKILHMKALGINNIDILIDNDEEVLVEEEGFTKSYDKVKSKTKSIFDDFRIGKKIAVSEINNEVNSLVDEITKSNNILSKLRQLEESDDYTFNHSIRVSILATMIGKWMNYSDIELKQISMTGLFHDIGKLKISNHIINKPGKLSKQEFEIIKKHTIYSYEVLKDTIGISKNIAMGALQHHEREDGSGYPLKVKGDKIHQFAKIIAICDVFDAMTADRVYRAKESPFKVAELILKDSFGLLDPNICLIFLNNISKFYVGNIVKLSNGSIGEIIYIHKEMPTRPLVKVDDDYIDLLKKKEIEIIDVIK